MWTNTVVKGQCHKTSRQNDMGKARAMSGCSQQRIRAGLVTVTEKRRSLPGQMSSLQSKATEDNLECHTYSLINSWMNGRMHGWMGR